MTNAIRQWVVYHPPKSVVFGHQSKPRDPKLAWLKLEHFLGGAAKLELGKPLDLTCYAQDKGTDLAVAAQRIKEARSLFGPEIESFVSGCKLENIAQMAFAVRFALDDDKFPSSRWGRSSFVFAIPFDGRSSKSDRVGRRRTKSDDSIRG
jgi:hypothetical protein